MKRLGIIALHAAYWMMYLILLLLFVFMSWLQSRHIVHKSFWQVLGYWPGWIVMILPFVLAFYSFYHVLFPRLLKTKRLLLLFVSGVGVSALSALLALVISGFLYGFRYGPRLTRDTGIEWLFISTICFIHGSLALVIKGFLSWYEDIHLKELLRQKNYEMELALIKSQLSPHFLFNTLNNIDVLIRKDAGRASLYLNQLSDILRFMLYETKTAQIPIQQELQYIDKYIQLQKLRTAHPEYIHYHIDGQAGSRLVEPMLFIPFIENAFKHAEKKAENAIKVRFIFEEDKLIFVCENKYGSHRDRNGGLGNSLIRRRLSLLYPGRHQLDITAENNIYKAILTLTYAN